MNKNILIITPFFPPQTHAAVFRAFKLVKYLKRTGWNPIVLTVNRNYLYLEFVGRSPRRAYLSSQLYRTDIARP